MAMYAVVSSGGKQYRVEVGSTLTVERLDRAPGVAGSPVTFDRVLVIGDGDAVTIGTPVVPGASVSATVLGEELGPKLVIFKFKQKVKYRRRNGHRQHLTRVRIDTINPTGEKPRAAEVEAKAPAKAKAPARAKANARAAAAPAAPDATPAEAVAEAKPVRARSPRPRAEKSDATAPEAPAAKPRPRRATTPKAKE
jgi:large subunit ribosomal protein L21